MKRNLFLPAIVLLAMSLVVRADEPPMIKIVVRASGPKILPESFGARPKTFYLAGPKYGRVEEELDREHGLHIHFVTNEPNNWIVNLVTKTAQHVVDRGPTFEFHAPIVWTPKSEGQPESDAEFKALDFGKEIQFFREQGARDVGQRQIDGKNCNSTSIKKGSTEVTLFVDPTAGQPYQIDVVKDGKLESSFRYIEYKTNLPFQKSLFEPPDGVEITEAQ